MKRIILWSGWAMFVASQAQGQPADQIRRDVKARAVMVDSAAGFIVGRNGSTLYILTAGHVLKKDEVSVTFLWKQDDERQCGVIKSLWNRNAPDPGEQEGSTEKSLDLGLVRCDLDKEQASHVHGRRELASWTKRPRVGDRVTMVGYVNSKFYIPGIWAVIAEKQSHDKGFVRVPSGNLPLSKGFSGAALLSDSSEILGIVSFQSSDGGTLNVVPWTTVKDALSNYMESEIQIRRAAPSGLPALPSQTQVTFGSQTLQIPGLGVVPASPWFRVSKAIPGFPYLQAAFEFTSAQHSETFESLQINLPAATAQYQLAHAIPWLRRHEPFSGVYAGGGIGWTITDDKDRRQGFLNEQKFETWAGIFETGVNYRLPGKRWGIHGSYREYLVSNPAPVPSAGGDVPIQLAHQRFRGFSFGMFVRLN